MSISLRCYSTSLGCPKNRVDTERLLGSLGVALVPVESPDEAELVFINTCAFIQPATEESVRTIAQAIADIEELPKRPLLAVAGCLVGRYHAEDLAPELPGSMETIDELAGEVRISIAHTTADYDTACEAFKHGARQVTHLYNAMPPFSHRAPGVIGAAFDNDNVAVELIADGVHVHPSVVRATFRLFENRVILISDSMMATGLDDGEYSLGGQAVTVRGNLATLHDGTIAGSATNLMDCVRSAVKMGVPLGQAIHSASTNPARAIGVEHDYGSLEPGKLANVLLLDEELNIHTILLRGRMLG